MTSWKEFQRRRNIVLFCEVDVFINRLFPNCVFCDYNFCVNWEFAWRHSPNKIFNYIVDGHESLVWENASRRLISTETEKSS